MTQHEATAVLIAMRERIRGYKTNCMRSAGNFARAQMVMRSYNREIAALDCALTELHRVTREHMPAPLEARRVERDASAGTHVAFVRSKKK